MDCRVKPGNDDRDCGSIVRIKSTGTCSRSDSRISNCLRIVSGPLDGWVRFGFSNRLREAGIKAG
jgi:hypothetical protein